MSTDPRWTGIYRHGAGYRAVVSLGRHARRLRQFPAETPVAVMQDWRRDEQARWRLRRKRRPFAGTFAADAARYLELVAGLTTIKDRRREIARWVAVFGRQSRDTITTGEILAQRDRWKTAPRAVDDPRPVSAGTINKRLRALSNLYAVLDPDGPNPVRRVDELREPGATARAVSYETIARILAAMPDRGRPTKGEAPPDISASKIRAHCLAYSQITPKQLSLLTPDDLDLAHHRLHLPARAKGRGADAVWVPLLPQAVDAFRAFHGAHLYGPFSQHALRKSWSRAATKAGAPGVRPYDLRHTYATLVYQATHSREAVQQLMQHGSWKTSARYALGADDAVRLAHGKAVVQHFGTTGRPKGAKHAQNRRTRKRAARPASRRPKGQTARKR